LQNLFIAQIDDYLFMHFSFMAVTFHDLKVLIPPAVIALGADKHGAYNLFVFTTHFLRKHILFQSEER
jgi:hypothetical protein